MEADAVARFEEVLSRVASEYAERFAGVEDEQALRAINARFVGPQGELTQLLKHVRELPADRRREMGQRANALKQQIAAAFDAGLTELAGRARRAELEGPPIDVTLPGRDVRIGHLHPITQVTHELLDIFVSLGFDVVEGPEVDLHEYNFDRLGFPPDHPATDMQDSFYVESAGTGRPLLRTHTSTAQIRTMLARKPPLAVVSPGVVYRRDDDATHSPMFHQLEGLLVDEGVDFADLKGVLTLFVKRLFGEDVEVRFRPSYFPFVEPGGEMDVRRRDGKWMEILGCGMVHPVVFENVGYDPERVSGFAFGMGLDRIAMLKFGIDNIKTLFENDVRFLNQL